MRLPMSEVQTSPVVSIGECMVELARGPDGRYGLIPESEMCLLDVLSG